MGKKQGNFYFDKLSISAGYSCAAAELLDKILVNFSTDHLEEKLSEMHSIEHAADIDKHLMMSRLIHEFITPIEREDIIQLSQELDDITDQVEEILRCIYMYNIRSIRPEALEFSKLVIQACTALKKAFDELPNFKKSAELKKHIIEINRIENIGDSMYTQVIRKLYTTLTDSMEILSWVKIFDLFENCFDSCEHVANSIERVVFKNS